MNEYDKKIQSYADLTKQENFASEYLTQANNNYLKLVNKNLQLLFQESGLVYHPEFIKFFHSLGEKNDNT